MKYKTQFQKKLCCGIYFLMIVSLTACSDDGEPNTALDMLVVVVGLIIFCVIFKLLVSGESADLIDSLSSKWDDILDGINFRTSDMKRKKYCQSCGRDIGDDEKYCVECGAKIER